MEPEDFRESEAREARRNIDKEQKILEAAGYFPPPRQQIIIRKNPKNAVIEKVVNRVLGEE
jgi:hypothetical protein